MKLSEYQAKLSGHQAKTSEYQAKLSGYQMNTFRTKLSFRIKILVLTFFVLFSSYFCSLYLFSGFLLLAVFSFFRFQFLAVLLFSGPIFDK